MNKRYLYFILPGVGLIFLFGILFWLPPKFTVTDSSPVDRLPKIDPDYTGIVIPPNIAPLNFRIQETGERYYVKIGSPHGESIEISSHSPNIIIPMKAWKDLLTQNQGQEIKTEIYVGDNAEHWQRFRPISNQIAREPIDSYLAYRLLHPAYGFWQKMGIYQRNLENYDEDPVLLNRVTGNNCMNCHSFCNNNPEMMILHQRGGPASGMLLYQNGEIFKVNTSTDFNRAGAYPAWHPGGKLLALSVNKLTQLFHTIGESRDVLDRASDLIIYNIETNTVTTCPEISSLERMETFPAWSPDGQYLYFSSTSKLETFMQEMDGIENVAYDQIKYDLMRIRYFPETETWGKLDTVLSAAETGKSITEPRISPDGRYVLVTMSKYSNFPIYIPGSDLYLVDINTGQFRRLDINSDLADTFHSWSSNSRWFVFSSKRRDGLCARPFFSYVDPNGKVHKPFVMPQKNPEFYPGYLMTYNVPELIKGKITVRPQALAQAGLDPGRALQAKLDPNVKPRKQVEDKGAKWEMAPQ